MNVDNLRGTISNEWRVKHHGGPDILLRLNIDSNGGVDESLFLNPNNFFFPLLSVLTRRMAGRSRS